jgi:peptidyl-prolyl cis-trans isomerase B (cyclophilin B)
MRAILFMSLLLGWGIGMTTVSRAETSEEIPATDQTAASEPAPAPASEEPLSETTIDTPTEGENPMVIMKTSKGDIKLKLFADQAPISVKNFLAYVDSGHYEGTIFHRVIPNFMIQGGGFTADMQQKPTLAPIKNEAQNGLLNKRGTVAMARTGVIDSATSQFFINVVDNAFLNFRSPDMQGFGYCVFAEVVEGMEVVDAIRGVPTGRSGPHSDVPTEAVEIIQVVRVDPGT